MENTTQNSAATISEPQAIDAPAPKPTTFVDVFNATISKLETDAKAVGSNLTEVCRDAGVSRTTPDRWKAKPPATVAIVSRMQGVIAEKAAAKAAAAAPAEPQAASEQPATE